jgi:hypothetical protein
MMMSFFSTKTVSSAPCEPSRQKWSPDGLKPVVPPRASAGGTLRSIPHYAPSELRRVPSGIHPRPEDRGSLRRRVEDFLTGFNAFFTNSMRFATKMKNNRKKPTATAI